MKKSKPRKWAGDTTEKMFFDEMQAELRSFLARGVDAVRCFSIFCDIIESPQSDGTVTDLEAVKRLRKAVRLLERAHKALKTPAKVSVSLVPHRLDACPLTGGTKPTKCPGCLAENQARKAVRFGDIYGTSMEKAVRLQRK